MGNDSGGRNGSRRSYLKGIGVLGVGALAGCITGSGDGGDGGDDGPIEVGAPAAQTGTYDYLQEGCTMVGELTIDQINDAGGPLDREFGWNQQDTGVDPQEARDVMDQMISVDGAQAICGVFSSEIPPNWDWIQDQQVPMVSFWPGSRFLDAAGGDNGTPEDLSDDEWFWRTMISDSVHTAGAVLNAKDEGVETFGTMTMATEGERSWLTGFADAVNAVDGVEIVAEIEAQDGGSSYQSELSRLYEDDFDCLVLSAGVSDAITVMRDWDQGGYDSAVVLSDGIQHADFANEAGSLVPEDCWISLGGADGPHKDQLISDFDSEFDTEEMGDHNHPWAIAVYDGLVALALAIHAGGSYDAESIEQQLGPITREGGTEVTTFEEGKAALDNDEEINFQGAMSECDFDDKGNVVAPAAVFRPVDGDFEELEPVAADRIDEVLTSEDYTVDEEV